MATVWQICAALEDAESEIWFDFQELGISNPVRDCDGAGIDTMTFDIDSETALSDDDLFAYHAYIRVRKVVDGVETLFFFGRVTSLPRSGVGGQYERRSFTVSGPGEQLASLVYRQSWVETTGTIRKPLVVLYQDSNGNRCTTGAQIYDALLWAKSCGARIAAPDAALIITGTILPYDERVNLKCCDVITECLRWHPHAVCWWDYTQRLPVFHCALRAALTPVSVALTSLNGLQLSPRTDLQIPAMAIAYTKSYQADDQSWSRTYFDWSPVIAGETSEETTDRLNGLDVVWANFDLDGMSRTTERSKIVVEDFPADYNDKAWWKARVPWLREIDDANLTLANGRCMNDTDASLDKIKTEGNLLPWMGKTESDERICVDATVSKYDGEQLVSIETIPVTIVVKATDASTKTYSRVVALDSGESVPEGVCAALYSEWSGLHYDGQFRITEEECSGAFSLGNSVNITGGLSGWSSMAAMVAHTSEHLDTGDSEVSLGPLRTVDIDSLVSLFRATRNRQFSYRRVTRTGAADASTDGEGSAATSVLHESEGTAITKRRVIFDPDADPQHKIDLNPAAVNFPDPTNSAEGAVTMQPRELFIITASSADGSYLIVKRVQVLASDAYGSSYQIPVGSGGTAEVDEDGPIENGTEGLSLKGFSSIPGTSTAKWLQFFNANDDSFAYVYLVTGAGNGGGGVIINTTGTYPRLQLEGAAPSGSRYYNKVYGTDSDGNFAFLETFVISVS